MSSKDFVFSKNAFKKASASLTDETTATPVSCESRLIFHPSVYSFANVGVLITSEISLSWRIVKEVGKVSSALPTIVELISLFFKYSPVPYVE